MVRPQEQRLRNREAKRLAERRRAPAQHRRGPDYGLIEPPRSAHLAPKRERPPELDPYLRPRLRAPALVQHRAQDAVNAEPGMPEAASVAFIFPPARAATPRWSSAATDP